MGPASSGIRRVFVDHYHGLGRESLVGDLPRALEDELKAGLTPTAPAVWTPRLSGALHERSSAESFVLRGLSPWPNRTRA